MNHQQHRHSGGRFAPKAQGVGTAMLRTAALTLGLFLASCSSVVPVQYYQLASVNTAAAHIASSASDAAVTNTLFIEPVQLAGYLNTNALILQTSAVQLQKATQHQWAEALDQQINRQLARQLASVLSPTAVVLNDAMQAMQSGSGQRHHTSMRLWLQIDNFHGTADGQVMLSGHYRLMRPSDVKVPHDAVLTAVNPNAAVSFNLQQAQPDAGYASTVQTMSALLSQLAQQIAVDVRR